MAVVHDGVAGVVCVQDPVVGRSAGDWLKKINDKHRRRRSWTRDTGHPSLLTRNLVEVDHELGEGGVHQPRRAVDAAVLAGPDNRQHAVQMSSSPHLHLQGADLLVEHADGVARVPGGVGGPHAAPAHLRHASCHS